MDIGVGSIITKGLGGPACNLLIFGPLHLYIEPIITVTPTPSPTVPIPTPTPSVGIGGGGGGSIPAFGDEEEPPEQKYKLRFVVKFRKRRIERTFIVDSFKKDQIIKRVGQINTIRLKFKVIWEKVKNNRFTAIWKK
jgi:hypothetical protein